MITETKTENKMLISKQLDSIQYENELQQNNCKNKNRKKKMLIPKQLDSTVRGYIKMNFRLILAHVKDTNNSKNKNRYLFQRKRLHCTRNELQCSRQTTARPKQKTRCLDIYKSYLFISDQNPKVD